MFVRYKLHKILNTLCKSNSASYILSEHKFTHCMKHIIWVLGQCCAFSKNMYNENQHIL